MHTYFVSNGFAVKIGKADDVARRVKQLQTASQHTLKTLFVIDRDCEKEMHEYFAAYRTSGEWFTLPKDFHDFFHQQQNGDGFDIVCKAQSLYHDGGDYKGSSVKMSEELTCPICQFNYQHFELTKFAVYDGKDDYRAAPLLKLYSGGFRGDAVRIPIRGECGHRWALILGLHKRDTIITAGRALEADYL